MPFEKMKSMIWMNKKSVEKKPEDELEKIDVVALKLKKKYGEYEDFILFIDYLASMERILVLAKLEKWKPDAIKKAFIEAEAYSMSSNSGIDEDIFITIKNDFQSAYKVLDGIKTIAAKLIRDHAGCSGCIDFIKYMRDTLVLLADISNVNIDETKDKILKVRMLLISKNDKGSNLSDLEEVYGKFKRMIKESQ
jgi:hypothetical protein